MYEKEEDKRHQGINDSGSPDLDTFIDEITHKKDDKEKDDGEER